MMQITADKYYGGLTLAAKELAACEKRGVVPSGDKFDFGVQEACGGCHQNIEPPKRPMRCSACRAVIYCSKACSAKAWKVPRIPGTVTHKQVCEDNKRHMLRLPDTQAIVKQFPWGRLESDGTFNRDVARGRFGVLGGDNYGFWSHRGGPVPHADGGPFSEQNGTQGYGAQLREMIKGFDHLDGKDLLKTKHLDDEQGWKLPARLIPYRVFSSAARRPVLVTDFGEPVKDWDSWYRWRKLPKESPAALIMDFPLSVYYLLVNCLKVTGPTKGTPEKRVPINIHMLGVEVELNYLPLFSELALLLPYHDIKLIMFGFSVHKLAVQARKHTGSLAAKASSTNPIFNYTAPKECGFGTIEVFLHGTSPRWDHTIELGPKSTYGRPNALVACNAGLGSYPDWMPVIAAAHMLEIPFAVTDYAEQSVEHQRGMIPLVLRGTAPLRREYPIELNPFQAPGQRAVPMIRLPNVINGFTLVVVKDETERDDAEGNGNEVEKLTVHVHDLNVMD